MANNVINIKGAREAPKAQRSSMETLIVTLEQVEKWEKPPFQRPLSVNVKIERLAEDIKRDACIPGIITLGKLGRSGALYTVDGQHRIHGFKMSGLEEVIADVRVVHFDTMAEMADEFVQLNTALVRMRPDDLLRGLEPSSPTMQRIRSECAYVGYDNIRRGSAGSPIVGMSMAIRCWVGSASETPVGHLSGRPTTQAVREMDMISTEHLVRFLHLAFAAWGRDPEYFRLWSGLNLTLCMWMYRRLVLDTTRGVKRFVVLTDTQFRQCLMSLSSDSIYLDYLQGRVMCDRDRSPTFNHLKRLFSKRLQADGNPKPLMPQPAWGGR